VCAILLHAQRSEVKQLELALERETATQRALMQAQLSRGLGTQSRAGGTTAADRGGGDSREQLAASGRLAGDLRQDLCEVRAQCADCAAEQAARQPRVQRAVERVRELQEAA
jgi:hypothetical protein